MGKKKRNMKLHLLNSARPQRNKSSQDCTLFIKFSMLIRLCINKEDKY